MPYQMFEKNNIFLFCCFTFYIFDLDQVQDLSMFFMIRHVLLRISSISVHVDRKRKKMSDV